MQASIPRLEPPESGRIYFWDESLPGFGVMITAAGHRSYVVQYRADGRSYRMKIGDTRHLQLDVARREAKAFLGDVARGGNPLAEKRRAASAAENTLEAVARRYLKHESGRLRSVPVWMSTLERLVFPKIGARPIDELRRSEIVAVLDAIAEESGPVQSDRVLSVLRAVMNWHARRADDFKSPLVARMGRVRAKDVARDRILTDHEIQAIWNATETVRPFNALVRFLLLTGARRDEAGKMRRGEIEGDLWKLPAERNKTKQDCERPLSSATQAVLLTLPNLGEMVFSFDGVRPVGGLSRLKRELDRASGATGWRLHDLRRTARSLMSRAGVNSDIAERCLGHAIGGVRGIYDRHRYIEEMRAAFEALAALIARIVDPQPNVVPMRG
jgi:integrase